MKHLFITYLSFKPPKGGDILFIVLSLNVLAFTRIVPGLLAITKHLNERLNVNCLSQIDKSHYCIPGTRKESVSQELYKYLLNKLTQILLTRVIILLLAETKRLREITKEKDSERGKKDNGIHVKDQKNKGTERERIVEKSRNHFYWFIVEINQFPSSNNKYHDLFTEGPEF